MWHYAIALLIMFLSTPAWATTRYMDNAADGGNDANSCAASADPATPKATFASAVACMSAGDTLYIRSGTYTEQLDISAKTGTVGNYLTFSAYPGETVTLTSCTYPFPVKGTYSASNAYFIFDGLIFDGTNCAEGVMWTISGQGADRSHDFIIRNSEIKNYFGNGLLLGGDNIQVLNTSIHDIRAQNLSGHRYYCVYLSQGTNILLDRDDLYNCAGGGMQIYPGPLNGVTVRNSRIHDNNSLTTSPIGGIIVAGSSMSNISIHHNEIYKNGSSGTSASSPPGIEIQFGPSNVLVYNNTFYGNKGWGIINSTADAANNVYKNNIVYGNTAGQIYDVGTGTVKANNLTTDPSFVDSANDDYGLLAASAAIAAGTSTIATGTTLTCNGTCDIGAHETFTFASASIDTIYMDVTLGMSLNTPLLPSASITGFTVSCTGAGCGTPVIASAQRKSGTDSVVRLTISGITGDACTATDVWTVSYAQTGNLTDSSLIGNSENQESLAFTNQAVTEVCTGTPTTPPSAGLHVHYKLDESAGAGTAQDETANNLDGTWTNSPTVVAGKTGNGLSFADGATEVYLAVPYGNALNPSTASISVCLGVLPHSTSPAQKIVFSADNGTNQRFYIGWIGGTWGIGIQSSGFSTGSEFPVVAEWTRLCLVADKDTDTATLFVNGVKGATSQAVKTYTSYVLASNFKVGVGTFSVNYGGSTADDVKIYAATKLTDQEVLDDYTAWNETTPAPTGTFTVPTFQFKKPRRKADLSVEDAAALATNLTCRPGGYFGLEFQINGTVANPDPISPRLYYTVDAGTTWLPVPDSFDANHVAFYGDTGDPSIIKDVTDYRLDGALTIVNGATQLTSQAVPNVDLSLNSSVVLRYVLKIQSTATVGNQICFKPYHQLGTALNGGYTPSAGACVTIMTPNAGM